MNVNFIYFLLTLLDKGIAIFSEEWKDELLHLKPEYFQGYFEFSMTFRKNEIIIFIMLVIKNYLAFTIRCINSFSPISLACQQEYLLTKFIIKCHQSEIYKIIANKEKHDINQIMSSATTVDTFRGCVAGNHLERELRPLSHRP